MEINNNFDLGDKVFVITRDKNKMWFVPKASYKIILINIQVFGHLNPPPKTQILYKVPNEYSKKALYPEARVFRDYECAATHCDVLNEYNLDELVIEEDGTIWTDREKKPCLLKQDDFFTNPVDNCKVLYYKESPMDKEMVWIYETKESKSFVRGCHISKIITDENEIMRAIWDRILQRKDSANGNK